MEDLGLFLRGTVITRIAIVRTSKAAAKNQRIGPIQLGLKGTPLGLGVRLFMLALRSCLLLQKALVAVPNHLVCSFAILPP